MKTEESSNIYRQEDGEDAAPAVGRSLKEEMMLPIAILAWIIILIVMIKGNTVFRVIAYLAGTLAVWALIIVASRVSQSMAHVKFQSEVVRPTQLILSDLNKTAEEQNYHLLKQKLEKTEELWSLYSSGKENIATGLIDILEMK